MGGPVPRRLWLFQFTEMNDYGGGGETDFFRAVVHRRFDFYTERGIGTTAKSFEGGDAHNPVLVLRGIDESFTALRIGVGGQDAGGGGADRGRIGFVKVAEGTPSGTGKGNEADALVETDLRELFGVFERVELLGNRVLGVFHGTGEDGVVDLVRRVIFQGVEGVRTGDDDGHLFVGDSLLQAGNGGFIVQGGQRVAGGDADCGLGIVDRPGGEVENSGVARDQGQDRDRGGAVVGVSRQGGIQNLPGFVASGDGSEV